MFRRGKPLTSLQKIRDFIWPRSGWVRAVKYLAYRLSRIPDSPYRVAAGLAAGVAISFTPFIGFHLMAAIGLGYLLRANMLAAAIGTIVGNPTTFPFIWVSVYQTGLFILGRESDGLLEGIMNSNEIFLNPLAALEPVLVPMTVGSFPWALVSAGITFWVVNDLLCRVQKRRNEAIEFRRTEQMLKEGIKQDRDD